MGIIYIHFQCDASKRVFLRKNGITQREIIDETRASLLMFDDGTPFENSPYVHSVERFL